MWIWVLHWVVRKLLRALITQRMRVVRLLAAAPHIFFMAPGSALHVFIAPASVVCTSAVNTFIAQWISCISLLFSICGITRFQVYGVGPAAAISNAIHEIFTSVFFLLSLPYTLLNTFLSQSLWERPECEGSHPLLCRSDRDPQKMARSLRGH